MPLPIIPTTLRSMANQSFLSMETLLMNQVQFFRDGAMQMRNWAMPSITYSKFSVDTLPRLLNHPHGISMPLPQGLVNTDHTHTMSVLDSGLMDRLSVWLATRLILRML